ncbi:histidinol-phosphatase [Lentilactobacillus fungorum]|uniref:Histidinol-phosphatase n=2 Tax=Lentilactobacillus fungorum TaxID=2201250 RepID=A0ABQ3W502_9LACO|nr:histidinol-phosphatase [Lentilactobacillus fungorum]
MMKREGHTHTEFCPHGSGEDVELMIQRAIQLGFDEYSITEHAPLPADFADLYEGQPTGLSDASMAASDLPAYLKKAKQMRQKYADQIRIHIGFEVDFLPEFTDWTRRFLDEYGPQTDDNLLSVHFLKGRDNCYWCVDDTLTDFEDGLLSQVNSSETLYQFYFKQVLDSVQADLGQYAPNRIGHITLIKKFQDYFHLDSAFSISGQRLINEILLNIKEQGRQLDLNSSGLYKAYCNEQYPSLSIIKTAKLLKIPMVYGSDAHSIAEVGRGYHCMAAMAVN